MNAADLKKVLKPLIKECIKEILFDEAGLFKRIIKETASAFAESAPVQVREQISAEEPRLFAPQERPQRHLDESKKQLMKAIGEGAYGGINLFENVSPIVAEAPARIEAGVPVPSQAGNPLAGLDPSDPGIDISALMGFSSSWKDAIKRKKS
jgi:hypothetical protein